MKFAPPKFLPSIASLLFFLADGSEGSYEGSPETWYNTYSVYPEYCSTIEQMNNRKIPSLSVSDSITGGSQLQQVTVVTRHGARTPSGQVHCWEGYLENPETGVWDCDLTTLKAPLPPSEILQRQGIADEEASPNTLSFDVKYDALKGTNGIKNTLGGNCMTGQLIMRGHQQLKQSGKNLREAYFYDSTANNTRTTQDPRLNLLDVSSEENPWDESNVYFRSTDKQRTILSGQTLLQSLFQPEIDAHVALTQALVTIPVHTGDVGLCPRLAEVIMAPDEEPVAISRSEDETAEIINFIGQVLGGDVDHFEIDCLMTTMCSDRPLPEVLDDYTGLDGGSGNFQHLTDFYTAQFVGMFTKNRGAFSKLAMGPFWLAIMSNVEAIVNGEEGVKFSLYAGHDLTLMPLLASIGLLRNEWVTYAGVVVLELHQVGISGAKNDTYFQSDHAFRLLYNGKVMTPEIEGCPTDIDLCDFQIFSDLIHSFATNFEDCALTAGAEEGEGEYAEPPGTDDKEAATTEGAELEERIGEMNKEGGVRGSSSSSSAKTVVSSLMAVVSSVAIGLAWI